MQGSAAASVIAELSSAVRGELITPDHPDYDAARTVVPGGFDRRPAVIVRPADAEAVAAAVTVAAASGRDLAVRSGGHSGAAHSVCDDGIVIDLTAMKNLEIDADARTAWAETGLTAGEFTAGAAEHGLATGFGDTASVGIGGITLGGGVGFLSRKLGLTIDSLLAAEVVLANGEIVMADETNHPDLFWALRGGGGNFGVVTRMKLRLHELPTVVGGVLMLPATTQNVDAFMSAAETAPWELTAICNVMVAPPMPFIPEEAHGKLVIMALLCFAGAGEAGEAALRPFRAIDSPLADMVRPISYPEMYPPEPEGYQPTAVAHTMLMNRFGAAEAATVMDFLGRSDAPVRVAQLRALGGAVGDVAPEATAYAHRAAPLMVNLAAFYETEDERSQRQEWVAEFAAALQQEETGAYVNFLGLDGPARIREAYPAATWDRLSAVKAVYDPGNLFRLNHNIPPAGATAAAATPESAGDSASAG